MRKFKFKDSKSLYYNWFNFYSSLLFPTSKKKREKAFNLHYYRFALSCKKNPAYDFEIISYKKIAVILDSLLGDLHFLEESAAREKSVVAAGVLGRLYYSLHCHGFAEASQNKVFKLYNYRFGDKVSEGKTKGKMSFSYAYDCLKQHRDELPYCVALSRCRSVNRESCDQFRDWLIRFFSTAEAYKDACREIKQARKAQGASPFIDLDKVLEVEWWHDADKVSCSLLKPYRLGFLAMYAARVGIRKDDLYSIT